MKILLTGGAGYIGSHASLSLLDAGHKVTIIDDLSTGNRKLVPSNASFLQCNINNTKTVGKLIQKENFDILMHFAGFIKVEESVHNPKKYFDNNTENAKVLFDTCIENNLTNIIFSSTAAIYGNPIKVKSVMEEDQLRPLNPYGESKIKTENYLKEHPKIKYIILRYFNVAGADPLLRSGLISNDATHLIKIISEVAIGKRDKIIIFGNDYPTLDGTAVRDYIHVSDLADIHLKAATHLISNQTSTILNCGYGKGFSVKEVIKIANKINDKPIPFDMGNRRAGDSSMLVSNVSKLKELLNWRAKHDDLSFIIRTSIDWEKKLLNNNYA